MFRLDRIVVILEVVEEGVIVGMEDCSRDGGGFCENIPGRGVVLASLVSGTELPVRHQEVKVVAADIILSQVDNCHGQTLLSVVVGGMFGDITDELCHLQQPSVTIPELRILPDGPYLDLLLEFLLEAPPDDLPLTGFKAITNGWDGTNVVRHREQDEFLVDKIGVRDLVCIMVKIGSGLRVLDE